MNNTLVSISDEKLLNKIYLIRAQKVMIDTDLATLYGVETKQLKRQVLRNKNRFPSDFAFELTAEENQTLRSQFGTLKRGQHSKYLPLVFTEHGILMLSSVLNSEKAIEINIQIVRIFIRIRQTLSDNTELRLLIQNLEKKTDGNTKSITMLFNFIDDMQDNDRDTKPRRKIGFK